MLGVPVWQTGRAYQCVHECWDVLYKRYTHLPDAHASLDGLDVMRSRHRSLLHFSMAIGGEG